MFNSITFPDMVILVGRLLGYLPLIYQPFVYLPTPPEGERGATYNCLRAKNFADLSVASRPKRMQPMEALALLPIRALEPPSQP